MNRRRLLRNGIFLTVAALSARNSVPVWQGVTAAGNTTLREKLFGCIVGCHVGFSLGALCEGQIYEQIEANIDSHCALKIHSP